MTINEISSAIINDLFSGNLVTLSNRSMISQEQIEDEVVEQRNAVIKEWFLKNLLKKEDMMSAINCVEVDCKDQNKCSCVSSLANAKMAKHFEIPQLAPGLGPESLAFVGSTDRSNSFKIYYSLEAIKYQQYYQKYRRRPNRKPFVYIEKTPNENGKYDGWIFDAPLVKYIAVIGIFKDPRDLKEYNCCQDTDYMEMGAISNEVKNRILQKKIQLYRAPAPAAAPVV
jgi:hypothetical protein